MFATRSIGALALLAGLAVGASAQQPAAPPAAAPPATPAFEVQVTTVDVMRAALGTRQRFGISYWDAAILEAGRALGCAVVLSEDLDSATDYDGVVATKLATILSGGALKPAQTVSEQYLLDLERDAFLSLCGEPRTLERIQYILKTGKPLRN